MRCKLDVESQVGFVVAMGTQKGDEISPNPFPHRRPTDPSKSHRSVLSFFNFPNVETSPIVWRRRAQRSVIESDADKGNSRFDSCKVVATEGERDTQGVCTRA